MSRSASLLLLMLGSGCALFGRGADFPAALNKVPELVVRGRVVSHDGKAFRAAHARLFRLESANLKPPQVGEVALKPDGSFELQAAVAGYYELEVTAVDHSRVRVPLLLEETVQLTVHLGTFAAKEDGQRRLRYRLKGEKTERGEVPFRKEADGTWVAESDYPKGLVQYEVADFVQPNRVNGPQAKSFEYDGDGDYWSEVELPGGKARIVVDPRQLPKPGIVSRVEFAVADSACAELARIGLSAWEARTKPTLFQTAGHEAYWARRLAQAREEFPRARHAKVRQRLLLEVLGAAQLLKKPELVMAEERALVRHEVDAADRIWGLFPEAIEGVPSGASDTEAVAYLGRAGAWSTISEVRAYALLAQLKAAYVTDVPRARELFRRLNDSYGGTRAASRSLALNPDRALKLGQKLPPLFISAVASEGGGAKVALHEIKGAVTLIDFWGPWCPPCVAEVPALQELAKKYASSKRPFRIYSVAVRTNQEALEKFVEKNPMPWSHARTEDWAPLSLVEALSLEYVPFKVLVDEAGVVLAATPELTMEELQKRLRLELGEEVPAAIPAAAPR